MSKYRSLQNLYPINRDYLHQNQTQKAESSAVPSASPSAEPVLSKEDAKAAKIEAKKKEKAKKFETKLNQTLFHGIDTVNVIFISLSIKNNVKCQVERDQESGT